MLCWTEYMTKTLAFSTRAGLLFSLLAQLSCVATQSHGPISSPIETALDGQVPLLLGKYRVASVGVALIEQGRVVLERAYGEQSAGVPARLTTM
jgi:hypothetical protein